MTEYANTTDSVKTVENEAAIEEALAQPEQWTPEDTAYRPGSLVRTEPDPTPEQLAALGWQSIECPFCGTSGAQAFPKPEWVGLTPADYDAMRPCVPSTVNDFSFCDIAAIIEAKLKEKNA